MSHQLKTVVVVWLGSNKELIPAFEFDFDRSNAQQALQQLVAKAMQCTALSARVLYKKRDVAPCPDTLETYELNHSRFESKNTNAKKAKKAWTLLQSELCSLGEVTLHASRFNEVNVWIHEVLNTHYTNMDAYNCPYKPIPKTIPPEAWHNRAFVLAACSASPPDRTSAGFFGFASKELQSDRAFMLTVCKRHHNALPYASKVLLSDRSFLLEVCTANGFAFRRVPAYAQADRELVLAASKRDPNALTYASIDLRLDCNFALKCENAWKGR